VTGPEAEAVDRPAEVRTQDYRPLRRRARWATALLVLGIVVDAASVLSGLMERSLLADIAGGDLVSSSEADANDIRQAIVAGIQWIVFVLTTIAFLFWFSRAYQNLGPLGAGRLRYGHGWAVGAWFVPILSVWRPKQIANDIWRASDPEAPPNQASTWRAEPAPGLYLAWWLAFVGMSWLYSTASRLTLQAEELSELRAVNGLFLAADALSVAAGVLAALVVHRTTTRQTARAERLGLVPREDPRPLWRRKPVWAALVGGFAAIALQGLLVAAAWTGTLDLYEAEPTAHRPPGTPSDAVFADDFSNEDVWLVRDDPSFSTEYVEGRYRLLVLEPETIWSSQVMLPDEVDSMSVKVDAKLDAGRIRSDYYGVTCTDSSGASYLFGISPDGYESIAFDSGDKREIELERLVEEKESSPFSANQAWNRISALCTPRGDETSLRMAVNGRVVAETTHRRPSGKFVAVDLFAYSGEGGTDVLFDDMVVRDANR
jgi:Domain of unknown function (DUF4328)